MVEADLKADLHRYLQEVREAVLWKLEGLSEYDIRRPMTPTGTNLLGLVKHLASVELGYFGDSFGRPFSEPHPWQDWEHAKPNADMYATADESRAQIVGLYRRAWAHSDETINLLGLDGIGHVPWWPPEHREVTLNRILVHVIAESNRHAGQADIVRELLDGAAGFQAGDDNLPPGDRAWWESYRNQVDRAAQEASQVENARMTQLGPKRAHTKSLSALPWVRPGLRDLCSRVGLRAATGTVSIRC
jgi:uncharacterized damage-inducible protein DinB